MAETLSSYGVNTNTAASFFGPFRPRGTKEDDIIMILKTSDDTAVMIVSLIQKEKEKERNYVAPNSMRITRIERIFEEFVITRTCSSLCHYVNISLSAMKAQKHCVSSR